MAQRPMEEWEWDMLVEGDWPASEESPPVDSAQYRNAQQRLRDEQSALRALLFRADCPESLELGEFALSMLPAARQSAVKSHLERCPHCQDELATLHAAVEQPLSESEFRPGLLRRILMKLQTPNGSSAAQPTPAMALRGRSWSASYVGGNYTLSLTQQVGGDQVSLLGSLLSFEGDGSAYLKRQDEVVQQVELSPVATFAFTNVPRGRYELIIRTPREELIVPELELES